MKMDLICDKEDNHQQKCRMLTQTWLSLEYM